MHCFDQQGVVVYSFPNGLLHKGSLVFSSLLFFLLFFSLFSDLFILLTGWTSVALVLNRNIQNILEPGLIHEEYASVKNHKTSYIISLNNAQLPSPVKLTVHQSRVNHQGFEIVHMNTMFFQKLYTFHNRLNLTVS